MGALLCGCAVAKKRCALFRVDAATGAARGSAAALFAINGDGTLGALDLGLSLVGIEQLVDAVAIGVLHDIGLALQGGQILSRALTQLLARVGNRLRARRCWRSAGHGVGVAGGRGRLAIDRDLADSGFIARGRCVGVMRNAFGVDPVVHLILRVGRAEQAQQCQGESKTRDEQVAHRGGFRGGVRAV